jgi:hypothetical protein
MATYKGIQGYTVQSLSDDPTASSNTEGQLWYNNSTGKFKIVAAGAGAWSSGGTMNDARTQVGGLGTSQSAGMIMGGTTPSTPTTAGIKTETYNGTAWTEAGDMTGGRSDMGTSIQGSTTAALIFGGDGRAAVPAQPQVSALTEEYNGSTWTEKGDLNTALRGVAGAGTSTAALSLGGQLNPSTIPTGVTETWNGTSWTNGAGFVNTERSVASGFGTATAALLACGRVPPAAGSNGSVFTESYDGSTWTAAADCNQQRYLESNFGTQTAGVMAGGHTALAVAESWNGTSWTTVASLATAENSNAGFGAGNSAGVSAAGSTGGASAASEEWNDPAYAVKTVTVS